MSDNNSLPNFVPNDDAEQEQVCGNETPFARNPGAGRPVFGTNEEPGVEYTDRRRLRSSNIQQRSIVMYSQYTMRIQRFHSEELFEAYYESNTRIYSGPIPQRYTSQERASPGLNNRNPPVGEYSPFTTQHRFASPSTPSVDPFGEELDIESFYRSYQRYGLWGSMMRDSDPSEPQLDMRLYSNPTELPQRYQFDTESSQNPNDDETEQANNEQGRKRTHSGSNVRNNFGKGK